MKKLSIILAVLVAMLALPSMADAQKINVDSRTKVKIPKVAIWPSAFGEGDGVCANKTAIKTCQDTIEAIFEKLGFEREDSGKINGTIRGLSIRTDEKNLPTPEEMLRLGKELNVDYVIANRWHWRIGSRTTITGLKTKAYCTYETIIVNVAEEEIEFHPEPYKCDSEKKLSSGETAAFLLVAVFVPWISGGPKTPHMQRSGQTACVLGLKPWLETKQPVDDLKIRSTKIK